MRSIVALTLGFAACACGAHVSALHPEAVPPDQGAVMGRIQVFKGDREVTSACYATFTTDTKEEVAKASLDRSGWLFITLPTKPVHLSMIYCIVWNGLAYANDRLVFDVMGGGATTYFGHVRFKLADRDAELFANAVASGLASVPITSVASAAVVSAGQVGAALAEGAAAGPHGETVTVEDAPELAIRQYATRYRQVPKVVTSLAGGGHFGAPAAAIEVSIHDGVVSAQVPLNGMVLTWAGVAREDKHWLGARVWRDSTAPALAPCSEVRFTLDGVSKRFEAQRGEATAPGASVLVKLDLTTLQAIASAADVDVDACGLKRKLSPAGATAARNVAAAYDSMLEDLPQKPRVRVTASTASAPTTSPAATSPPDASQLSVTPTPAPTDSATTEAGHP